MLKDIFSSEEWTIMHCCVMNGPTCIWGFYVCYLRVLINTYLGILCCLLYSQICIQIMLREQGFFRSKFVLISVPVSVSVGCGSFTYSRLILLCGLHYTSYLGETCLGSKKKKLAEVIKLFPKIGIILSIFT